MYILYYWCNAEYDDAIPASFMDSNGTVYFSGDTVSDADHNIRIEDGVEDKVDCYRLCLMINDGLCNVFRLVSVFTANL